jgi:hypothetical protein
MIKNFFKGFFIAFLTIIALCLFYIIFNAALALIVSMCGFNFTWAGSAFIIFLGCIIVGIGFIDI